MRKRPRVQNVDVISADDVKPDVAVSLTTAVTGTQVNNVGLETDDGEVPPAAADDDVDNLCSMCHLAEPPARVCHGRKRNRFNAMDAIDGSTRCVLD